MLPFRNILTRPTMRAARVILAAIVFINIIYFSSFRLNHSKNLYDITRMYSNQYTSQDQISLPRQPTKNYGTDKIDGSTFQRALQKKFRRVEKDKERYWLADTKLTETSIDVKIKPYLKNHENEHSWVNKNALYYDPRFTLSIYLNELKNQYTSKIVKDNSETNIKADANKIDSITLPFNWADWMDLTILNDELSKPIHERINCLYIKTLTNNDPDPSYFCLNNEDFPEESVQKLGYKNKEQLPGFIIHGHSSHDDRPYNDIRILESRSYAMTHLPKPLRVVILNGGESGGTYEFDVDPQSNQRLAGSDMVLNYLLNNQMDTQDIHDETILHLDHTKEFKDLIDKVTPKYLSEQDDVHKMYKLLRKQSDPTVSKELVLEAELFNYPSAIIQEQIDFYENKNHLPTEQLSRQEKLYYEGLKDCSNYDHTNEPTYFKMSTIRIDDDRNRDHEWGWHYDWRFFNGALNYDRVSWTEQELIYRTNIILDRLLRNWYRFAEEKGIVTWIMHGPLLSWYWDGLMFPFDVDIDIQMPVVELIRLAKDYNQTLIVEDPNEGYGKFLIDVGTYVHNRDISETSNHIDARVVDVDSGIYIDITGLSKSKANPPEEYNNNDLVNIEKGYHDDQNEIYNDRRKHFYKLEQLSPLRYSMMGGVPVFIPQSITDRLIFEYPTGLSSYEFNDWYFIHRLNLWLKRDQIAQIYDPKEINDIEGNIDKEKLLNKVAEMPENEVLRLLDDDDILVEYYLTKDLSDLHAEEKQYLFDGLGRDNTALNDDNETKKKYNKLVSTFKMRKPLRKALYDYENIERLKHHNSHL